MNDYEKLLYKSNKQKRQLGILIKKITYYKQELQRKDNNWNELKEWVFEHIDSVYFSSYDDMLDKIKELEERK